MPIIAWAGAQGRPQAPTRLTAAPQRANCHYNPDVISKIANLPERSVRYFDSGSGRVVVWLHAFPLSAEQWLPQFTKVPPGWRFVAPDLRGFGGGGSADAPGLGPITVDDYAADVLALMAHLEIKDAVIAGSSLGGYVAFAIFRRAPQRVAGLALIGTRAGADSDEAKANRQRLLDVLARDGVSGVARDMLPKLLGETTRREQPDLVERCGRMIEANSAEAVGAAIGALEIDPTPGRSIGDDPVPDGDRRRRRRRRDSLQRSRRHARRDPSFDSVRAAEDRALAERGGARACLSTVLPMWGTGLEAWHR